jgi:DNA-nicking Smr family endonuclease
MTRRLTSEERELWENLRRSVRPLRVAPAKPEEKTPEPARAEAPAPRGAKAVIGPDPKPPARLPPPLVPLEERERRRLARGLSEVDARIDLHGMRQERAYSALLSFLYRSQARNQKTVLVITGKGREGHDGRGVLRQSVPAWLARPEFRDLVVGIEEAGRRHGGAGALYVRLRRRREPYRAATP